jgi:iron-sulfur cluster assembly protein
MITLTEKAMSEIKRLQGSESKPVVPMEPSFLRIQVIGGGCSGMSYKLGFETAAPSEKDQILEKDGIKVVIDSKSGLFLKGTELDFTDGLNGRGFVFNNPNTKRSCGCGNSFSV